MFQVKLAQHTYSQLFGTFLCNTRQERLQLRIRERTFSVWRFLNSTAFVNHLYSPLKNQVYYMINTIPHDDKIMIFQTMLIFIILL